MKALLSKASGGPETLVLEDVPAPVAKPGQAVVDVKAVGVNFPDVLILEDRYQFRPARPFAPGCEISGVVGSVGEGVSNVSPGDRVLASPGWGGMAEQIVMPAERLVKIPDAMPFDEAAAFIMTYGTSWHALKDRADLQPGQSLLVLGAAGGVGLAAIELGKALGARVIAAASSQAKVDLCLSRGAAAGLVYPQGPFDLQGRRELAALFRNACGPKGADVIYDPIGDPYAEPALRSIAWEGKYLVVGFAAGGIPRVPLNLPLLKGCAIVGVLYGMWGEHNREPQKDRIAQLLAFYASGKIRPHVSERFPLDRGGEAIARLAARQARGKVVVML